MPSTVNIDPRKLAAYLDIANKQRLRALSKAQTEYHANHPICIELERDHGEIIAAIGELRQQNHSQQTKQK